MQAHEGSQQPTKANAGPRRHKRDSRRNCVSSPRYFIIIIIILHYQHLSTVCTVCEPRRRQPTATTINIRGPKRWFTVIWPIGLYDYYYYYVNLLTCFY